MPAKTATGLDALLPPVLGKALGKASKGEL